MPSLLSRMAALMDVDEDDRLSEDVIEDILMLMWRCVNYSDVTKLFKICVRRMRISASKICRMQMRMSVDKGLFYHSECNTLVYVN